MREDAFRAFLKAAGYTDNSVASRMSRARSVERRLSVDLDGLDLSDAALPALRERLAGQGSAGAILANEVNAVRTYRRFRSGEAPPPRPASRPADAIAAESSVPAMPVVSRNRLVADASVATLLAVYGEVLDELRDRQVIRTANAPVGDYAERLFAQAFGWKLASNSAAGYEAIDPLGDRRIQIKGRRLCGSGARQLGVFRDIDAGFDVLAASSSTPT